MDRVTRYQRLSASIRRSHAKSVIGVVQARSTTDIKANLEKNEYHIQSCL